MSDVETLWSHRPDPAVRRRTRTRVRFGTLAVNLVLVRVGWSWFGVAGGLAGVGVMLLTALMVERWARHDPDDTAQWIWLDRDGLCADGPELFEHDGEAFEFVPEPPDRVIRVDAISWASVYPSITDADRRRDFHLVVDLGAADGDPRRCLVLDRRQPFRIGGETALARAIRDLVGDRWVDPVDVVEPFGEIDRQRLSDWESVAGSA